MKQHPYPRKIISSGQTGVDRAGLDAALDIGLPIGGYVPQGRLAEDGRVPEKYPMTELTTPSYPVRTRRNVVASDGTLILADGRLTRGTSLTAEPVFAARIHRKGIVIYECPSETGQSDRRDS